MGLLDFDDEAILKRFGKRAKYKWERQQDEKFLEDNFSTLQNLGRKENSEDFSDSPFADRKEV